MKKRELIAWLLATGTVIYSIFITYKYVDLNYQVRQILPVLQEQAERAKEVFSDVGKELIYSDSLRMKNAEYDLYYSKTDPREILRDLSPFEQNLGGE